MVSAASAYLDERRQEVNDLNVFPVADGDTGDNMALTLRAVSEELDRLDGQMVDEIGRTELVNALARAALMGARGNSGVILSQIVRGAAEELASRPGELIDPALVAASMARAADAAYESVREPAEGTMLTVFREMAHSVSRSLAHMETIHLDPDAADETQDAMLAEILEKAVRDGEAAVNRTPEQLEILRESGVVDAGAHGLVVIMAGIVAGLRGDIAAPEVAHHAAPAGDTRPHHEDSRYQYCTNFIVQGSGLEGPLLRPAAGEDRGLRPRRRRRGDAEGARAHGRARRTRWRCSGTRERSRSSTSPTCAPRWPSAPSACSDRAGARSSPSLRGTGCASSSRGSAPSSSTAGDTFNPSIYDLLAAIHEVPSEEVLVMPNNPNVVMAAERAAELSDKDARVVDCTAPQAGLVALLELDPEQSAAVNGDRLSEALDGVRTGSVAAAARDDKSGPFLDRRGGRLRRRRDRRVGLSRVDARRRRWPASATAPSWSRSSGGGTRRSRLPRWSSTCPRASSSRPTTADSPPTGG